MSGPDGAGRSPNKAESSRRNKMHNGIAVGSTYSAIYMINEEHAVAAREIVPLRATDRPSEMSSAQQVRWTREVTGHVGELYGLCGWPWSAACSNFERKPFHLTTGEDGFVFMWDLCKRGMHAQYR
jgi:hypothetical protein